MDMQITPQHRNKVEEFRRKHRTALLTLIFTDIVGSTKIKQDLGDQMGVALIQRHHKLIRELLSTFPEGEEIDTSGDSFFIMFVKPSDSVKFSLLLQSKLRALSQETPLPLYDRIGIHLGEVIIEEREDLPKAKDLFGIQVDSAARVMSLSQADQILMTRSVFDNARQVLKGQELEGVGELLWMNHGLYTLKGVEDPIEICEVGEKGNAILTPPPDSEKAFRHISLDSEPVLGWRPALEQVVPGTEWVLEEKLGEGAFGEVWKARQRKLKDYRVFKFCFRADRVRSLKREVTIFRILKERLGEHPHIVRIYDVFFDEPPYYIMTDYVEGKDLITWCKERGGVEKIPLPTRLEIAAQTADALSAAYEAGVIHRDIKPSNLLIAESGTSPGQIQVKLSDFGIGQVISDEILVGKTRLGFTQTILDTETPSRSGTHLYMAPELIGGKPASQQSDLYSLGVILYQLLVGDLFRPLATDWGKNIKDPLLKEDLEHCFAGNPADRFADGKQLAKNLRAWDARIPGTGYDLIKGVLLGYFLTLTVGILLFIVGIIFFNLDLSELSVNPISRLILNLLVGICYYILPSWYFVCRKYRKSLLKGFAITKVSRMLLIVSVIISILLTIGSYQIAKLRDYDSTNVTAINKKDVSVEVIGEQFLPSSSRISRVLIRPGGQLSLIIQYMTDPIILDLYFLGFIFPILKKKTGTARGILLTSLWFSISLLIGGDYSQFYSNNWTTIFYMLALVSVVIIQRHVTGSLIPSLVTHCTYNLGLILIFVIPADHANSSLYHAVQYIRNQPITPCAGALFTAVGRTPSGSSEEAAVFHLLFIVTETDYYGGNSRLYATNYRGTEEKYTLSFSSSRQFFKMGVMSTSTSIILKGTTLNVSDKSFDLNNGNFFLIKLSKDIKFTAKQLYVQEKAITNSSNPLAIFKKISSDDKEVEAIEIK